MLRRTTGIALLVGLGLVNGSRAYGESVLMVVTSAAEMDNGKPTGLWLEEFAVPYAIFREAGMEIAVASPKGGKAPVDPRSLEAAGLPEQWIEAAKQLEHTQPLDAVAAAEFDAVFLPGGHGTMFDFPDHPELKALIEAFAAEDKPVAAVCHGPAALVGVDGADGRPLVTGRKVTAFTNEEEKAVELTEDMPFLLETRLRSLGADFSAGPLWASYIQVDGKLVTGQNPASSKAAAEAVVKLVKTPDA